MAGKDYYQILGLGRSASEKEELPDVREILDRLGSILKDG